MKGRIGLNECLMSPTGGEHGLFQEQSDKRMLREKSGQNKKILETMDDDAVSNINNHFKIQQRTKQEVRRAEARVLTH